jgi:Asp-tRNA(Asn)/Glu-tRNA(Gln) amidotransferase A subunit family amidase
VGVKDIVHVDGFETRAGTALPPSLFAGSEASVVTRLREAGAVVLGRTVTAEFAGSEPGPTRNPHDPGHTPGGSSSGSAAAVAAGECPLALGTQTGGSVIRPAAFCGVVGVLPGAGRVPTDGVVPRSPSVDRVGLMTQDVAGAALAASVVCDDWTPVDRPGRPTLGVPTGPLLDRPSEAALAAFRDAVDALAGAGFEVVRTTAFADLDAVEERHRNLTRGELARVHEEWFDEYESLYRPRTAEAVREGRAVTDAEVDAARAGRETTREAVQARMDEAGVDLWVTPAAPGPAPASIEGTGSPELNRPWTYTGLPAVSLPAGTVDGLPVGLQCVSRLDADERLLAWATPVGEALSDALDAGG